MAVTVAWVLETADLGLKLLTGSGNTSNPVRWVHVSELPDPTPFLRGGEILLSTGMRLHNRDRRLLRTYVDRLADADVAGLGFGVGLSHETVPGELVTAAHRRGLPLFEVPLPTPFLAIGEAVASRLAAEQREFVQRAFDAQQALTKAALHHGQAGVLWKLAVTMDGWAALCDPHGRPQAVSGPQATQAVSALREELTRLRERGPHASASLLSGSDHVIVQPLLVRQQVLGLLVTGRGTPYDAPDRLVLGAAVALLALELGMSETVAAEERRLRADVLDRLLAGQLSAPEAAHQLRRSGFPHGQVRVTVLQTRSAPPSDLARDLHLDLQDRAIPTLVRTERDEVTALLPDEQSLLDGTDGTAAARTLGEFAARVPGLIVGVSGPVAPHEAATGLTQARASATVGRTEGRGLVAFETVGTYQLLLGLQDQDALAVFADRVLGPLDADDAARAGPRNSDSLTASLRAFLSCNTQWATAAAELGIHRNTLRYRLRKVEELTGRRLDSAYARTELWLALQARALLAD